MTCRNCGKEIDDNNSFCPFCGEKIITEKIDGNSVHEEEEYDRVAAETGLVSTNKENAGRNKKIVIAIAIICLVVVAASGMFIVKGGVLNQNPLLGVYEDENGYNIWCFAKDKSFYSISTVMDVKFIGDYQLDSKNHNVTLIIDGEIACYKYSFNEEQLILEKANGDDSGDGFVLTKTDEAPESSVDTSPDSSKLIGAYRGFWVGPIYFGEDGLYLDAKDQTTLKEGTYEIDGNQLTIVADETETFQYEFYGDDLILYKVYDEVSSQGKIYAREDMDEEDVRNSLTRRWSTYFSDRLYGTDEKNTEKNAGAELTVKEIKESGVIESLNKENSENENRIPEEEPYAWLYCKSEEGNIIVLVTFVDFEYEDEETGEIETETYWYMQNTDYLGETLDNVHFHTFEGFGQAMQDSYNDCINVIKKAGYTYERIE